MEQVSKTTVDIYRFYRGKEKVKNKVNNTLFRKICNDYNKFCAESLLEGKEVTLPFGLGKIMIIKKEINWDCPPVNWKETKKAGKIVYHTNMETNNLVFRFKWISVNHVLRNCRYYSFKATKTNRRNGSKEFVRTKGKKYRRDGL